MIPLLLLPGMMCDARLFGPQIASLSGRLPLMTVPVGGHETMSALAAEILTFAPPKFAIAGLSLGGIVAMEILRQAPTRVAAAALIDTNPLAETDDVIARRAKQIEAVRAGKLQQVMTEEMKPNYLAENQNRKEILSLCMEMAEDLGSKVFINQSKALRSRQDQTNTLRAYRGQTLILCGRNDALCPISRHELMYSLVNESVFEIVEEAAHLPTLEQPEQTTAALLRWIDGF